MMHKAWCSIEEVPYYFSGSSIKFRGHTGWKIDDSNPIWVRLLGRSQLSNPSDLLCFLSFFIFVGCPIPPKGVDCSKFSSDVVFLVRTRYIQSFSVASLWKKVAFFTTDKQRVLMHGHQGWNVRHGLCHIYMIYVYIWVVYSFCLFCCLFIIVTTQFVALYKPCKPKPKSR